jgi:hypothetical protein
MNGLDVGSSCDRDWCFSPGNGKTLPRNRNRDLHSGGGMTTALAWGLYGILKWHRIKLFA